MVAKLKKFFLVSLNIYEDKILDFLQELGISQIITFSQEKETSENLDYNLASLKFAIDFLSNFKKPGRVNIKNAIKNFLFSKIILSSKQVEETISSFNWQEVVEKIKKIEVNQNEILGKIKKLSEEKERIYFIKDLDFNPNKFSDLKSVYFFIAKIQTQLFGDFEKEIKNLKLFALKKIYEDKKDTCFLMIYDKSLEKEILKLQEVFSLEKIEINFHQPPKNYFFSLENEIKKLNGELNKIQEEINNLLLFQEKLKISFDYFKWKKEKEDVEKGLLKTKFTFSLLGWIEEEKFPILVDELKRMIKEIEIKEIPIQEGESIPVLLKNKGIFKDFEIVTTMYGLPNYSELDPTPYLTPFFIFFFAFCLSDAGYGLVLALISYLIMKIFDVPKKEFFKLLIVVGLATFFVGALFGSWFGIELESLPVSLKFIKDFLLKIKIIDPAKNPLSILIFSLYLGAIQIITGLIINFYWKIKNKNKKEALLDVFPWIFLLSGILFFALSKTKVFSIPENIVKYWVIGGAFFVVLTQGRKQKNIFLKIPSGIMSLYGLISYLSDVLSYSRLLALGLATSIIGMVINLIAKIFNEMFPGIGFLIAALVLIVGHLFNISINALGSFIHSARLQFVEFFPKFMEGGGNKFQVFKKEGKYIELKD